MSQAYKIHQEPYHLDEGERAIIEEAELLIAEYSKLDTAPKSPKGKKPHTVSEIKNRALALLWKCHLETIRPPENVIILFGILLGRRQDWPAAKFAVIDALAEKYDPPHDGEAFVRGTLRAAAQAYEEFGGLLQKSRKLDSAKGNENHRYEQTVRPWLSDPVFKALWAHKRRIFLNRSGDFYMSIRQNLLEIVEAIVPIKKK